MEYVFKPEGVCSRQVIVTYNELGIITDLRIIGGCGGNTQGISSLVRGMKINDVIDKLSGIKCPGSRTGQTSCPDQIANGLKNINQ